MTCLNKLFLHYMQVHGFTCGLDDLMLKRRNNKQRKEMLERVHEETVTEICKSYNELAPKNIAYMGRSDLKCDEEGDIIPDNRRKHVHHFEEIVRYFEYKVVNEEHAL